MRSLKQAMVAVTCALLVSSLARGAPGGVYAVGAPSAGFTPEAKAASSGENVSRDGDASHQIRLAVPPGRNGLQPDVRLSYSSRGAVRGGVAAGWSLPLSTISVDTSEGRAQGVNYEVDGLRLIEVPEPGAASGRRTFRADRDGAYVRYEKVNDGSEGGYWIARLLDGTVMTYGSRPNSKDVRLEGSTNDPLFGGEGRWMLSEVLDSSGNQLVYNYESVWGYYRNDSTWGVFDLVPVSIEYGKNLNVPSSTHHARVDFVWNGSLERCPGSTVPVGAQFSFRTGIRRYLGARKLLALKASVRPSATSSWQLRRELTLSYDTNAASCSQLHGPMRLLTSVQERAIAPDGAVTTLPPTSFEYGPLFPDFAAAQPVIENVELGYGKNPHSREKPGGWPAVDAMRLDLDGDGVAELVDGCSGLPKMPWANGVSPNADSQNLHAWEGCSLSAQVTHRTVFRPSGATCGSPANFFGYRFMDVNGDGRPDLVAALNYQKGRYRPSDDTQLKNLYPAAYPACSSVGLAPCLDAQGDRIACLHNQYIQAVYPMMSGDQGWAGLSNGLYNQNFFFAAGGGTGGTGGGSGTGGGGETGGNIPVQCPQNTCARYEGCSGTSSDCCGSNSCVKDGPRGDPPEPSLGGNSLLGPQSFQEQGRRSPGSNPSCGHVPDLHCGRYVWWVYLNKGEGSNGSWFESQPRIVHSPVALEGDQLTSGAGASEMANASMWRATADLDGDGFPDALYQTPDDFLSLSNWNQPDIRVWWGNGQGGFLPTNAWNGTLWATPRRYPMERGPIDVSRSRPMLPGPGPGIPYLRRTPSEKFITLRDVNGDGLPDYVSGTNVYFNTGRGFERTPTSVAPSDGSFAALSAQVRTVLKLDPNAGDDTWSQNTVRLLDLDADGLEDLVVISPPEYNQYHPFQPPSGGSVKAFLNTGDGFSPLSALEASRLGVWRQALAGITTEGYERWRARSDVLDVDGDGLFDLVETSNFTASACPTSQQEFYDLSSCGLETRVRHAPSRPLRVLTAVNNGAGARTVFEYASSNDASVVNKPQTSRLPSPVWVVKRVTTTSGTINEPALVSDYRYEIPVSNVDRHGRFGFRGFARTIVTGPTASTGRRLRTISDYSFNLDESGLLTQRLVGQVFADGHEELVKVSQSIWQALAIFQPQLAGPSLVTTYGEAETRETTCRTPLVGMLGSLPSCLATGVLVRTVNGWQLLQKPVPSPGFPNPTDPILAWTVTSVRRTDTLSNSPGDQIRKEQTTFRHSGAEYRLLNPQVVVTDGSGTLLQKTEVTFETGVRALPTERRSWRDAGTYGRTWFGYDAYGNVQTLTRPVQAEAILWGTGGASIFYGYDALGLFRVSETDEKGHLTRSEFDLATGAQTLKQAWAQPGVVPTERTRIDGLGRPLDVTRTTGRPGAYVETLVQATRYSDFPPRTLSTADLRDASTWVLSTTWLDGLGRATRVEMPNGRVPEVMTKSYDGAGNAVSVRISSPSGTGESEYVTEYDAFQRPLRVLNPSTAPRVHTYTGTSSITEELPSDSGPRLYRRVDHDAFGRVTDVFEGAQAQSRTRYGYDALDRLVSIVDADNVSSTLSYDLAGNRTVVQRGSTRVETLYDLHGNPTVVFHPTPSGAIDAVKYATYYSYDSIDRVTASSPMSRSLTKEQVEELGWNPAGPTLATTYEYDDTTFPHGNGRLTRVRAPHGTTTWAYSIEGFVEAETRSFAVRPEGGAIYSHTSVERRTWDLLGNLLSVTHPDQPGAQATISRYGYDARGRPESARIALPAGGELEVARFFRNGGGRVTKRTTPSPTSFQAWQYDAAGRILDTVVEGRWCELTCTTGVIAGERFGYFESGMPRWLVDLAKQRTMSFGYDDRLQLTNASSDAFDYVAAVNYSPSGRVQRARVQTSIPGAEVSSRFVDHDYTPRGADDRADLAAVRVLRNTADGTEFASLFYDAAGNLTRRIEDGRTTDFLIDGDDQVREVRDPATGERELYWYDHHGERVLTWRSTEQRLRHRFNGTEVFVLAGGAQSSSTVDVQLGGSVVARVADGDEEKVELLFHGALSNLLASSNSQGLATARYGYAPWGEVLYAEGPSSGSYDRRYESKAWDAFSRLSYFGRRYYDPLTLSWTQADPKYRRLPDAAGIEPRRISPYTYVLNTPLAMVDPDGLDSEPGGAGKFVIIDRAVLDENGVQLGKIEIAVGTEGVTVEATAISVEAQAEFFVASADILSAGLKVNGEGLHVELVGIETGVGVKHTVNGVTGGAKVLFGISGEAKLSLREGFKIKAVYGIGGEIEITWGAPEQLTVETEMTVDEQPSEPSYQTFSQEDPAPEPQPGSQAWEEQQRKQQKRPGAKSKTPKVKSAAPPTPRAPIKNPKEEKVTVRGQKTTVMTPMQ